MLEFFASLYQICSRLKYKITSKMDTYNTKTKNVPNGSIFPWSTRHILSRYALFRDPLLPLGFALALSMSHLESPTFWPPACRSLSPQIGTYLFGKAHYMHLFDLGHCHCQIIRCHHPYVIRSVGLLYLQVFLSRPLIYEAK
jgi:hypothetical protein